MKILNQEFILPSRINSRFHELRSSAIYSRHHIYLSIAACLLLIFSFSYQQETTSEIEVINSSLLLARVFPLILVVLLSWISVPRRDLLLLVKVLLSVPFVFWCWYALVGTISGVASEIQPLWSAWKCLEILIVMLWASAVYIRAKREDGVKLLKSCYSYLLCACYLLLLWTLISNIQEYNIMDVIAFESGARLSNSWPNINPLSLAIISAYCLLAPHYVLPKRQRVLAFALSLMPLVILVGTRARTGILAVGIFAILSVTSRRSSPLKKCAILTVIVIFLFTLAYSENLGRVLRVSDYDEILAGGGRFSSAVHDSSAWGKSIDLIAEAPAFGLGYLNIKRFIPAHELPVDNFLLQALISAGFVGAIPFVLFVLFFAFQWTRSLTLHENISRQPLVIVGLGNVALSLAFAKALTTNELSNLGFALILFLLVVIGFNRVKYPYSRNRARWTVR